MEGEDDELPQSEEFSTEEEEEEEEDWCFVCHDGGDLIICDYDKCPKSYHVSCVRKSRASLKSYEDYWECAWHSCYKCKNPSNFCCYLCPNSLCSDCVEIVYFFRIKGKYGFCNKCTKRIRDLESIDVDDLSTIDLHFKECLELLINREGFDLNRLLSEMEKEQEPISKNNVEGKKSGGMNKRRIETDLLDVSDDEDVGVVKGPYAAIVKENIELVYLRKGFVLELLKEAESFESRVIGCFVRVRSRLVDGGKCRSSHPCQLVQVAGVKTEDLSEPGTVKLQLANVSGDVSVDSLSDGKLTVEEVEVLRQNFEDGLLKKPTVEELERKAKDLHRELTRYNIHKELIDLKDEIDKANERRMKSLFLKLIERKEQLETDSEVRRMMDTVPEVIAAEVEVSEIVEPVAENTMDEDKRRKRSSSLKKSRKISSDLEDVNKMKSSSVPLNFKLQGIKGDPSDTRCVAGIDGDTLPRDIGCVAGIKDTSFPSRIIKGTLAIDRGHVVGDDVIQGTIGSESSDTGHAVEDDVMFPELCNEMQCNKTTSEKTTLQNSISRDSALDDEAMFRMLDGLNRPSNVVNHSFVSVPSKAIDHFEKGFILSLKEIPVSHYKELMIPFAKDVFATLHNLNIDCTKFRGCVKEYIRSSARLAQIDDSKNSPSVEELSAEYESKKSCYEKCVKAFDEISKSSPTESEISQGLSEHGSRLSRMVEMSKEMVQKKKEMLEALNVLDDRRYKWLEEEKVKEDFENANTALDCWYK